MGAHDHVVAGSSALAGGEWAVARDCFEAALSLEESAEALDGLALAMWWLNDPATALELRARAFARLRHYGRDAGAGSDLAELKATIGSFLAPFPDLTADIRYLVQEDDLISSWISYTATHAADFAGVPASNRHVNFAEWDMFRVRDDKIIEITQYCDLFKIMSQIGALPTAAPA